MTRVPDPFEAELLAALPAVRGYCIKLTRSADRADDLVQDTVAKALHSRGRYELGTNMTAWLCTVARNLFLGAARRPWRSVQMADGAADKIAVEADPVHVLVLREALEAVGILPPEQAEALMLVANGADYEEVALLQGIECGTAKSRVSRARAALDVWFGER